MENTYFDGTMVQMADGSMRNISNVQSGDRILTKNGEMLEISTVLTGIERVYVLKVDGKPGDEIVNTDHAQFIENKNFKR
ncbi:MAG: hypothetical protein RR225_10185 [Clostridium sp.]